MNYGLPQESGTVEACTWRQATSLKGRTAVADPVGIDDSGNVHHGLVAGIDPDELRVRQV